METLLIVILLLLLLGGGGGWYGYRQWGGPGLGGALGLLVLIILVLALTGNLHLR